MVVRLYSPSINLITFSNIIPVQDRKRRRWLWTDKIHFVHLMINSPQSTKMKMLWSLTRYSHSLYAGTFYWNYGFRAIRLAWDFLNNFVKVKLFCLVSRLKNPSHYITVPCCFYWFLPTLYQLSIYKIQPQEANS